MKKMKVCNRGVRAAVAGLLAAGLLAGCGGQSAQNAAPGGAEGTGSAAGGAETSEFVYVADYVPIRAELENGIYGGVYANGSIYATSYERIGTTEEPVYDPETGEPMLDPETGEAIMQSLDSYGQVIYKLALDGGLERLPYTPKAPEQEEDVSIYTSVSGMSVAGDGTIYLLEETDRNWNDAPADVSVNSDDYWQYQHYTQSYALKTLSPEGEERATVPLDALAPEEDGDYFYINGFETDADGRIYLGGEQGVYVLDSTGTLLGTVETENWIERLVSIDGRIYCAYYEDGKGEVIAPLDAETLRFGEGLPVNGNLYSMTAGGGDYDLYYTNGINFFGYDLSTGESTKLLNWISCDVDPDNSSGAIVLDDGRIVQLYTEWEDVPADAGPDARPTVTSQLIILSQKPASSVPQKEIITLATQSLGWNVRSSIIDFNRKNDRYRIEVRDYSEYNNYDSEDEADWSAGLTKLKTEILSGNVPDILDLSGLPLKQFANKGFLEDLYPWLDSDPEVSRDALIPSVLKALEINGGLYQTCDGFGVQTVVGASAVVGDKPGWTLEQYRAALAGMPEGCEPFDRYTTRPGMLSTCLSLDGDSFVNWNTGECSFDSEAFVALLEFVNSFPAEFQFDEDAQWSVDDEPPARIARGEQMLYAQSISYLDGMAELEAIFGGEMTFIGYPTAYGTGNMFDVNGGGGSYAMSSKCSNKEAAWEFLRQFFSESYQDKNTWRLPTNINSFEKKLKSAMTPSYVTDSNGNPVLDENGDKIEIDYGSWSWGGVTVQYHPMTQAEADQVRQLIETTSKTNSFDEEIYNIVLEGAAPFFDGQRSAQEVAKQIQSKAMLYVNEQR